LIANELKIDFVLVDVAMPEMKGAELARAIHATRPTLPVILITGYRDLDVLKEIGESQVLQKPCSEAALIDKIMAALN
jgi:FixJ family two-component response regulator